MRCCPLPVVAFAGSAFLALLAVQIERVVARNINSPGHFRPNLDQNSKAVSENCASSRIVTATDTCVSLAEELGITYYKFKQLNSFIDCNNLPVGQAVCADIEAQQSPKNALGDLSQCITNYTLSASDSCGPIAAEFGLTSQELLNLNIYLDCTSIVAGTIICVKGYVDTKLVPAESNSTTSASSVIPVQGCLQNTTVSSAENCITLTSRYNISVTDLYNWNLNLECWDFKDGDKVCVKAPTGTIINHSSTATASATSFVSASSASTSSFSAETSSSSVSSSDAPTSTAQALEPTQETSTTEAPAPQPTTQAPAPDPTPTPEPTTEQQPTTSTTPTPTPTQAPSTISDAEAATLNKHNSYRSQYGMPSLIWDSGLASEASSYSNYLAYSLNCALVHSGASGEGENLESYGGTKGAGHQTMDAAVDDWMTEDPNSLNHASQVLWRATKKVGCGQVTNTHSDGSFCLVTTCRYYPIGNVSPYSYYNS
ncbi:hypothetical protein DFJ73DRAFT_379663 [Zopfochytrium polystomum]|nr:hypothetical protein DFJ73DRAFT_379663 [Zopfochytrium polystomum]